MSQAKVYIIHENPEWTKNVTTWLDQKGIPYEDWHLGSGVLDLTSTPTRGNFLQPNVCFFPYSRASLFT